MYRFALAILVFTACGSPASESRDAGNTITDAGVVTPFDAGTFTPSATLTGSVIFPVGSPQSYWVRRDGGADVPLGVMLLEPSLACPDRLNAPPAAAGLGILLQSNSALRVGTIPSSELTVVVAAYDPSRPFPAPIFADFSGSISVSSLDGGVIGSISLTSADGGVITGTFAAKKCGPYCGSLLCP